MTTIDAVTLTLPRSNERYLELTHVAEMFIRNRSEKGYSITSYRSIGGFEGVRCGSVGFGESKWGAQITSTGSISEDVAIEFSLFDVKCTRIDLQITVDKGEYVTEAIREHLAIAEKRESEDNRYPTVHSYSGKHTGFTVYIGARSSSRMIRIYDKFAESKEARFMGHVRYELELKKPRSQKLWDKFAAAVVGGLEWRNAQAILIGTLIHELEAKGIDCGFDFSDAMENAVDLTVARANTDLDRKLAWLRRSVRPTVQKLMLHYPKEDIIGALGLWEWVFTGDSHGIE